MSEIEKLMGIFRDKIMIKGIHVYNGKVVSIPTAGMLYYSGYGTNILAGDIFFDSLLLQYFGNTKIAIDTLKLYLSHQREDGFLARIVCIDPHAEQMNPLYRFEKNEHAQPFLCQSALMLIRACGGRAEWLDETEYEALCRYLWHWKRYWVRDDSGLCVWNSAEHRMADAEYDDAGSWRSLHCQGVDLACYLRNEYLAAAELADVLGRVKDKENFILEAEEIKKKIQCYFWDEEDGFFYDRDVRTGEKIKRKNCHGMDVLAYGVASSEQAERIVKEHLQNPEEFWTEYPVPEYARKEQEKNGRVLPRNVYVIVHGLQRYGYHKTAEELIDCYEKLMLKQPLLYEWYDAENGNGLGTCSFYAGTHMLPAFLRTELEIGFNPYEICSAGVLPAGGQIGEKMHITEIPALF